MEDTTDVERCRTCLSPVSEDFVNLSSVIDTDELRYDDKEFNCDKDDDEDKIRTYLDCLLFCTHLKDSDDLPLSICTKCSISLQSIFGFIQKAKKAHETLTTSIPKLLYKCELCGKGCQNQESLYDHYSTKHNVEVTIIEIESSESNDKTADDLIVEELDDEAEFISEPPKSSTSCTNENSLDLQDDDEDESIRNSSPIINISDSSSDDSLSDYIGYNDVTLAKKVKLGEEQEAIASQENLQIIARAFRDTTCKICNMAFPTKHRLEIHAETHRDNSSVERKALIEEVKKYPCIYDREYLHQEMEKVCKHRSQALNMPDSEYRKRRILWLKSYAWKQIASKLDMSPSRAIATWALLKKLHTNFKNRQNKCSDTEFIFEKDMEFLNSLTPRT